MMQETSLRVFIAIELNDEARHGIELVQKNLQKANADVKWVKPSHCHITLKFLGTVTTSKLEEIKKAIKECTTNSPAFLSTLTSIGAFPTVQRPQIIWIGINDQEKNLISLTNALEEKLITIGFPKEKREFAAHVTIGRVKSNLGLEALTQELSMTTIKPTTIDFKILTLFQSVLSSDGPSYSTLDRSRLKQKTL